MVREEQRNSPIYQIYIPLPGERSLLSTKPYTVTALPKRTSEGIMFDASVQNKIGAGLKSILNALGSKKNANTTT